jgi:hypothetical protein
MIISVFLGKIDYKYLVLFHYLFRLIETLFFYGAIYKKKTHYVLLSKYKIPREITDEIIN